MIGMILNKKVKPNMQVALGKELEKGLMVKDLAKASPILISGESGTGKTTLMKHIIMQLIQYNYEDELRLSLVEGRDSNFKQFANLPHLIDDVITCLLYTSPSPRDVEESRMPSSA